MCVCVCVCVFACVYVCLCACADVPSLHAFFSTIPSTLLSTSNWRISSLQISILPPLASFKNCKMKEHSPDIVCSPLSEVKTISYFHYSSQLDPYGCHPGTTQVHASREGIGTICKHPWSHWTCYKAPTWLEALLVQRRYLTSFRA